MGHKTSELLTLAKSIRKDISAKFKSSVNLDSYSVGRSRATEFGKYDIAINMNIIEADTQELVEAARATIRSRFYVTISSSVMQSDPYRKGSKTMHRLQIKLA